MEKVPLPLLYGVLYAVLAVAALIVFILYKRKLAFNSLMGGICSIPTEGWKRVPMPAPSERKGELGLAAFETHFNGKTVRVEWKKCYFGVPVGGYTVVLIYLNMRKVADIQGRVNGDPYANDSWARRRVLELAKRLCAIRS